MTSAIACPVCGHLMGQIRQNGGTLAWWCENCGAVAPTEQAAAHIAALHGRINFMVAMCGAAMFQSGRTRFGIHHRTGLFFVDPPRP